MSAPTIRHDQQVGRVVKSHGVIGIYIRREAVLTDNLSDVESVRIIDVQIRDMDGYENEQAWSLTVEDAGKLYRALGDAVMACMEGEQA